MSGFSTGWLDLRERADHAARNRVLVAELVAHLEARGLDRPPRFTDLGSGTGSTVRALAPYLPAETEWLLVDYDPALVAGAVERLGEGVQASYLLADLARGLEDVLAAPADVVSGSALIDLCGAAWLDRLAAALPADRALYLALSYDGVERWHPETEGEAEALAAFLAHQRTDKGFGPALGPDAAPHLAERLRARGFRVHLEPSPWRLVRERDAALIAALAEGSAAAVAETGRLTPARLAAWAAGA